jgi:glycosyl hydrolase family 127 (putative beta-L-arabinofuranosidase)
MLRTPARVLTGALALLFLFPLAWAAVASVAPQAGTAQVHGWGLGNYQTLAHYQAGVGQYLLNSTAVSLMTVAFTLIVAGLGGYAFALFTFPGRNALFLVTLAILMVPYATLLIPLYVLLNDLGLQNSLVGLALVLTMFQLPFAVFMMRISFEAVPRELRESSAWSSWRSLHLDLSCPPAALRPRVHVRRTQGLKHVTVSIRNDKATPTLPSTGRLRPLGLREVSLNTGFWHERQGPGTARLRRRFSPGDMVVLDLPVRPRITVPDPRIDAVRGCVAVERGPIVLCAESVDLPPGADLNGLRVLPNARNATVPSLSPAVRSRLRRTAGPTASPPSRPRSGPSTCR